MHGLTQTRQQVTRSASPRSLHHFRPCGWKNTNSQKFENSAKCWTDRRAQHLVVRMIKNLGEGWSPCPTLGRIFEQKSFRNSRISGGGVAAAQKTFPKKKKARALAQRSSENSCQAAALNEDDLSS